jgi:hypothetical protein
MAHAYFSDTTLTPAYMEDEILKTISYEEKALGYFNDTSVSDTALFARTQYGLSTRIIDAATVSLIKNELDNGNVVIAPMAGRYLPNPYFTPPGPLYHMLVIIGYDSVSGQFITNDPGTRNGAGLRYSYDSLMSALHDWTGDKNTITTGAKRVLIIENENKSS